MTTWENELYSPIYNRFPSVPIHNHFLSKIKNKPLALASETSHVWCGIKEMLISKHVFFFSSMINVKNKHRTNDISLGTQSYSQILIGGVKDHLQEDEAGSIGYCVFWRFPGFWSFHVHWVKNMCTPKPWIFAVDTGSHYPATFREYNTPWKMNMEHNHRGWEDHVPFKMGGLNVPC